MPRNVRNFWIAVEVDGRSEMASGPVAKDGGFTATVLMREKGSISENMVRIRGWLNGTNGELILDVDGGAARQFRIVTER